MRIDRIVVGVDGSANSLLAVEWTAGMAQLADSEVVAVHTVGLLAHLGSDDPSPANAHREEIRAEFERTWCAPLDEAGLRCRRELHDGNPVQTLLTVAEAEDADLIVVGCRGLGGYPELLLGSTSTQVAQHSSRPVVIVPGPPKPPTPVG